MRSNALRMKQAADVFYRLAVNDPYGVDHGALIGLRTAAAILEDTGLVEHIDRLLDLLKRTPDMLSSESETVPLKF